MPFSIQQTNAATRVLIALGELRDVYYELRKESERLGLLGIPAPLGDYPAPGDLNHITARTQLTNANGIAAALVTWMTTPADLDGNPGSAAKTPIDAIVEALR